MVFNEILAVTDGRRLIGLRGYYTSGVKDAGCGEEMDFGSVIGDFRVDCDLFLLGLLEVVFFSDQIDQLPNIGAKKLGFTID